MDSHRYTVQHKIQHKPFEPTCNEIRGQRVSVTGRRADVVSDSDDRRGRGLLIVILI